MNVLALIEFMGKKFNFFSPILRKHINLIFVFFFSFYDECKRRYNIKLWKTFTDCFNCLPVAAIG